MEALKNSLNLSNEFRLKDLNDPINYQVSLREKPKELSEIPLRYMYKERKIKEHDSFGGYRYYSDNLKKRTNPTEEYRKQLEEELIKKKKILSDYELNGQLSQEQINTVKNSNKTFFPNTLDNYSYFNDVNDITEKDVEYFKNASANDNLLKVLDSQVDLLKRKGDLQFKKLSQSDEYNHLTKTKKYGRILKNQENGLDEPGVYSQFLAANNNRVQTLKHVITQDKPEYIPLEELTKLKEEHEKDLLDIEDEYYGRKKISEEELMRRKEEQKKLKRLKELNNMIQRPGYNNDLPLEQRDYEYINKYNKYLINKQGIPDKIGYEEEWNTTKIKSQNANGFVDRNDGLPGYLDQDDYKLYYYDINDEGGELNFERPLKTHKHSGRENTLKRTFRIEPGYENTKGKFYRTGSMPDMTNKIREENLIKNNNKNNGLKIINEKMNNENEAINNENKEINAELNKNKSIYFENNINKDIKNGKNEQFIKLIFGMLSKNEKGEVPKNKILTEMKLDNNSIKELGFLNKEDFQNKLNKYPSKKKDYLTEEEFYSFISHKEKNNNQIMNQIPIESYNLQKNSNENSEILPGMSTSYFDFLKNPSTTERLEHINRVLEGKNINDIHPHYKKINTNKNKDKKNINFTNLRKNRINKSFDNEKNNIEDTQKFYYTATNSHFNINKYSKKSDLNFTIPKPFEFLKEDYHGKKLIKMREILEERKKNEDDIFKHTFHANPFNKKLLNKNGDLRNIIEREKAEREARIQKRIKKIEKRQKPIRFYDAYIDDFKKRKKMEYQPPTFKPFKANGINYKSQVNMYDGIQLYANERRKDRIHQRALSTFNSARLPKRMEMHEKQKKLQEQENIMIERAKQESEKNKRLFKAKDAPNFTLLHEKFMNILEKKKRAAQPTIPKPFTFHEPKKKAELCQFLDAENKPNVKNPQRNKKIQNARIKMQKKPDIEPPSTKSLKLLMDKRRKDLEIRKKNEENIKREDEARIERQKRLNSRVRSSSVIQGNKKALELNREEKIKTFKENLEKRKKDYDKELKIMKRNVENRPLMMEIAGKENEINEMKQNV